MLPLPSAYRRVRTGVPSSRGTPILRAPRENETGGEAAGDGWAMPAGDAGTAPVIGQSRGLPRPPVRPAVRITPSKVRRDGSRSEPDGGALWPKSKVLPAPRRREAGMAIGAGLKKQLPQKRPLEDSGVPLPSTTRIFVSSIPPDDCTQPVLEEFFSHFGQVTSVSIPVGALGHATISFATAEEADRVFEDPETLVMSGQLLECKPCVGGKGQPRGRGSQGTSNGNWTSQEEQWGFEEGQGTSEGNWASQEEQWGFEEGSGKPKSELPEQGGKSNVIGQSKGEPHRPREGPQDHTNSARRRWPPRGGKGREESARPKEGLAELTEPKLFVRRLPQATTEDELREYFESFGTVKDLALIYHPDTGAFRGYGFVSFEDLEAARAVLQNYDNNWFKNRWIDCQVKGAGAAGGRTETSRLLVEGVAQTLKEELREHLECFGTVKEMTFTGDGRCEVTFGLSGSAAAACAKASIVLNGEALRLSVMEEQRTRPDEGEGDEETTKMVFLQKVPEDWTSVEARQYFQKFGQVVELTLPFEADGERGALLTFDSCESSAKAIAFAKVGAPKPYFAGAAVKAEKEPPQEVFLHVRNVAPGRRLDTSDVFKIFGKYSLARIRDLEGEAMVEFASTGECIKAFEEQDGVRANGVQLALEGSTRDAFMEFRKRQERTWGGPRPPGR
ncbi:unnamed protein product [Durusdinium trenchii]|uniref:RRM domain-containing protein n=1 Tax=Durusdinium trenchii TaxID=1381693 RepID=A0ABP0J4R2_9DINO